MSTPFSDLVLQFVDAWTHVKGPEESCEESREVRDLRTEYGTLLLAEQAKAEELEAKLIAALVAEKEAYRQLRVVTNKLQAAGEAHRVLHQALYGIG